MFQVFREHAAPSAVLMFNAGPSHGEAIGHYRGDPLYHASLDPAEYARLLDGIGFIISLHTSSKIRRPAAGRCGSRSQVSNGYFYSAGIGVAGAVGAVGGLRWRRRAFQRPLFHRNQERHAEGQHQGAGEEDETESVASAAPEAVRASISTASR